jgi:hypothetical protein
LWSEDFLNHKNKGEGFSSLMLAFYEYPPTMIIIFHREINDNAPKINRSIIWLKPNHVGAVINRSEYNNLVPKLPAYQR